MTSGYQTMYVRVTGTRGNRFVEFDFAIGDPRLYVELLLPFKEFQEFCMANDVVFMTPEQEAEVDRDRCKWRYGSPGARDNSRGR